MPKFSGTQKASILSNCSDIKNILSTVNDEVFKMNKTVSKMYFWDFGGSLTNTTPAKAEQKPFKPRNKQLISDYNFWNSFIDNDIVSSFNTASLIDINNIKYQNISSGVNQFIGWCDMVINAYLTNDISCYRNEACDNVIVDIDMKLYDDILGVPQGERKPAKVNIGKTCIALEPSDDLTDSSILCKVQTLLQGKRQVYFDVSPYAELVNQAKQKAQSILNELNQPTPDISDKLTGVSIDSTGTSRILQAILDFSLTVTLTFKRIINLVEKGNSFGSFILLFLREDTKKDLNKITEYISYLIGGDPDVNGTTSTNEIKYIWLIGSEGNYYPAPPVESTDLSNDVYLSTNNGIIYSLKRADDNARWRYRRTNDALFEIATNNNLNKAYLDDLSPRIIAIETSINEFKPKIDKLQTDIDAIKNKLDSIETKIDGIITKLETP